MNYAYNCIKKLQVTYDETKSRVVQLNNITYLNVHGMTKFPDDFLYVFLDQLIKIKTGSDPTAKQTLCDKYDYYINNWDVLIGVVKQFTEYSKPKNVMQTYRALLAFFNNNGSSIVHLVNYAIILHYIKHYNIKSREIGIQFKDKLNEYLVDISDEEGIEIDKIREYVKEVIPNIFDCKTVIQ